MEILGIESVAFFLHILRNLLAYYMLGITNETEDYLGS